MSVLKFAAATSISAAAMAASLPAIVGSVTDLAGASVQPAETLIEAGVRGTISEIPERPRPRNYARVEELPPAGVIAEIDLTSPHDSSLPAGQFAAREKAPAGAKEIAYSTFALARPEHRVARTILARLPQARPGRVFSLGPDGTVEADSAVLAYAEAPADIQAPFDAVIGDAPSVTVAPQMAVDADDSEGDSDLYRPRPRPDPDSILGWLDGRALGQFAPGQHDWVRNPLPASVHDASEQRCLAQGIYFEARGEPEEGQAAVAQVILNRVRNPAYPKTICGVVYQNESWRHHCQFSFACDGRPEKVDEKAAWATAQRIALDVTSGKTWVAEVGDSTHYHAGYVSTRWDRRMIKVDRLGEHIFYRTKNGGWS